MIYDLKVRLELLTKEHGVLIERYKEISKEAEDLKSKLNVLVGHVSEVNYQIKAQEDELLIEEPKDE